ncbi:hypothetical protein ACN2CX_06730 [Aliarcobacter butzleri]|uniref:hypothetical protein n=1 Tax=Aliarcobacter butzleri TaxID=28197 RepID=UPI003AFA1942
MEIHLYILEQMVYMMLYYKYPSRPQEIESYAGNLYLDSKFETFGINHLLTTGYSENYYKYSRTRNWAVGTSLSAISLNDIKNLSIQYNYPRVKCSLSKTQ